MLGSFMLGALALGASRSRGVNPERRGPDGKDGRLRHTSRSGPHYESESRN